MNLMRRGFLVAGGVGMLSLSQLAQAQERNSTQHKAVINIFLGGGPPHQDMWDIKHNAPSEIRGEFNPISTNVAGIQIGECFPMIASMFDKFTAIRSVVGCKNKHDGYQCATGWPREDKVSGSTYPAVGSVTAKVLGSVSVAVPPNITLLEDTGHDRWFNFDKPGYLGTAYKSFNPNGEMMFMTGKGSNPGDVDRFDLSARFLPTSANMTHFQNYQITEDNSPEDIHLNPTGTEMFIVGSAADQVHQYSMHQPFALSNASHTFTLDITSQESSPSGIHINPTGTKMFIVGAGGKEVNEYTMNVPFTLSSASHTHAFSVSSQENNPRAIWFDNTGRKMFIIGFTGDDVNVYKMIPGFNLYNATFVDGSKLS